MINPISFKKHFNAAKIVPKKKEHQNEPETKIIATIGPASSSLGTMRDMIKAGMDVARLNFSHGTYEEYEKIIHNIRKLEKEFGKKIYIMLDLQGRKIRVGEFQGGEANFQKGDIVNIKTTGIGNKNNIIINLPQLINELKKGSILSFSDGKVIMEVKEVKGEDIKGIIKQGGTLKNRSGVSAPGINIKLPPLSEKDEKDIAFGLKHSVDMFVLSFVQTAKDMEILDKKIKETAKKISLRRPIKVGKVAKIETKLALSDIEEIIKLSDKVMIGRGDLRTEIPIEEVPNVQEVISTLTNKHKKELMIATGMETSMVKQNMPTQAEGTDIRNAVRYNKADYVMLSEETSIGEHPIESVDFMERHIKAAENAIKKGIITLRPETFAALYLQELSSK